MIKLAIGYSKSPIQAKQRAIYFYDQAEGRKIFKFVETQQGLNEINEVVWVTTIWFELLDPLPEQEKVEEKHEFIGSTDIDPNDPNWHSKWQALQESANEETMAHIADH